MASKQANQEKDHENQKPFTEEAHDFLKIIGKYVYLKQTSPSLYETYHEETRKFLEEFKNK